MDPTNKKILVVDDEPKIIEVIKSFLESKGFLVLSADNGKKAIEIFERETISLVLLDLMLPEISGEEVCRTLRTKSKVPIIMLTAKVSENDILNGFGIGADDYITKPFRLSTLYARVEAVLRRTGDSYTPLQNVRNFGDDDLTIDFETGIVRKKQNIVSLTPNEFRILTTLIKYSNKVFTREELINTAFGSDYEGFDRTIDSHIKNIRQKIEDNPKDPIYIKTVYGVGYKFGGK